MTVLTAINLQIICNVFQLNTRNDDENGSHFLFTYKLLYKKQLKSNKDTYQNKNILISLYISFFSLLNYTHNVIPLFARENLLYLEKIATSVYYTKISYFKRWNYP